MEENNNPLSERQAAVLDLIRRSIKEKGYPPTRREIEEQVDISSVATSQTLEELEQMGYIEVDRNRARGLKLREPAPPRLSVRVPVLGDIHAGVPAASVVAEEHSFKSDQSVEIPSGLLSPKVQRTKLFALHVQGDGLIDVSIGDGDLVILEANGSRKRGSGHPREQGEIVAVRLPDRGEAVLTRLYREKDGYRLQPANRQLQPIHIAKGQEMEIDGKVVAVIRSFGA
jgi:repressor LexA